MRNQTRLEARQLCNDFIQMKYSDKEIADILISLSDKKETSEEISGFVDALLENAEPFPSREPAFDVCGTGGSKVDRFNISTAVAFILASLGIKVAKHGNRGSRKPNGSFDLLENLGIPIDLNGDRLSDLLNKTNLAFVFANKFHPAMKNVTNARKIANQRTIFNLAGPLSNPANIKKQIIGTIDKSHFDLLLKTSISIGREKCLVVSGEPGIDELSISGVSNYKSSWEDDKLKEITPKQMGLAACDYSKIPYGNSDENAQQFMNLIEGSGNIYIEYMVCTEQVLTNIEKILKSVYAKLENIIKFNIFISQGQNPQDGFHVFQEKWGTEKTFYGKLLSVCIWHFW